MLAWLTSGDRIVDRLTKPLSTEERKTVPDSGDISCDADARTFIERHRNAFVGALLLGAVGGFMFGGLIGIALTGLACLCLMQRERSVRKNRIKRVERDLPALLTSVASSVRAGIDPLVALSEAREFLPTDSVLKTELDEFHISLSAGGDEDQLISRLFRSVSTPDIELFKGCLRLSRKHGGSLAEPLHRVTRVVRQRQSFRRKTRAALAMHRMSAVGISLCAALIALMQVVMNPDGIQIVLTHSLGSKLLFSGGALIVVGVVWMMSMGRETSV
jgi:Flp pilus assembly protein TadB